MTDVTKFGMGQSGGREYRLISVLGEGGFGAVYRGELRGAGGFTKSVAIKLLNAKMDGMDEIRARFRDEARILALLRHRAIVMVEDLVELDGRWAVVMEYIDGADLKALLKFGPVPLRPLCQIIGEVASALKVAHEAVEPGTGKPLSIVHRDIKPANIRLTAAGEVKVLDFGVARAEFSGREAVTRSLSFGSMGFLAPERMDGIDVPAGDIYSLGGVLYESLTGNALGQLSVDSRRHGPELVEKTKSAVAGLPDKIRAQVLQLLSHMLIYDYDKRLSAGAVSEICDELFLACEGLWLKRWAPDVIARVGSTERAVDTKSKSVVTGSLAEEVRRERAESSDQSSAGEGHSDKSAWQSQGWGFMDQNEESFEKVDTDEANEFTGAHAPRFESVQIKPALPAPEAPQPESNSAYTMYNSEWEADDEDAQELHQDKRKQRKLIAGVCAVMAMVAIGVGLTTEETDPEQTTQETTVEVSASDAVPTVEAAEVKETDDVENADDAADVEDPDPPANEVTPVVDEAPKAAPKRTRTTSKKAWTGSAVSKPEPPGGVQVDGHVAEAWLISSDGSRHGPGPLEPGTYELEVTFPNGQTINRPGLVTIQSGVTTRVQCDAAVMNCRAK